MAHNVEGIYAVLIFYKIDFKIYYMVQSSTTVGKSTKPALHKCSVMCRVHFGLYALTKTAALYCLMVDNWLGFIGFTVAFGYAYVAWMCSE